MKNLAYTIGKKAGGIKVLKYLARNHPRILMYHRIKSSVQGDGIHVDTFRRQMNMLRDGFNVISLNDLLQLSMIKQPIPKHAVVITFDDGYADFYDNAFPVLQEFSLPATLFVTTGFVDNQTWLWPDKIKFLLSETKLSEISVPEINRVFRLKVDENKAWHAIADFCLTIPDKAKKQLILSLAEKLGVDIPVCAPNQFRSLNWGQIKEMSSQGLDVGSHSVSHPVMTKLELTDLRNELILSKEAIELHINKPVEGFCYPNGLSEDINDEVKREIRSAKYQYAIAAFPSDNPLSDVWEIKRYAASSDLKEFEKTINGFRLQRLKNS